MNRRPRILLLLDLFLESVVGVALEIDQSITPTTHERMQFFSDTYMQQKENEKKIFLGTNLHKGKTFLICCHMQLSLNQLQT